MKTYKIDEKLLNAIIQYLAQRPYAEVAQAMKALSSLVECEITDG